MTFMIKKCHQKLFFFLSKKCSRKNNFPRILCFPSAMSHIRKSTKMGFPGNRPKMPQLHKFRKSSEMVVRGWYMTHFDRRDLLQSKKQVWGGFRNLSDLPGPICEISRFFSEISVWEAGSRKPIFLTSEYENFFEK